MITITIKQSGSTKTTVRENVVTKRIPTAQREKDRYSDEQKALYEETYAVVDVEKVKDWTVTLLEQNVLDDAQIDLAAIITAINKL
jgi:hypothetical protein